MKFMKIKFSNSLIINEENTKEITYREGVDILYFILFFYI